MKSSPGTYLNLDYRHPVDNVIMMQNEGRYVKGKAKVSPDTLGLYLRYNGYT
jgi:hypothetical protein